jgi:excisionase family DNA binding protein
MSEQKILALQGKQNKNSLPTKNINQTTGHFTIAEVAAALDMKKITLYKMIEKGEITPDYIGRLMVLSVAEIEKIQKRGRGGSLPKRDR